MKVLVCGSRYWKDERTVEHYLSQLPGDTHIIHGDCRGADKVAAKVARKLGFEVSAFPADWSMGRQAGPERNSRMIAQQPDLVVAFHENIENSKGTRDTLRKAASAGIQTRVIIDTNCRTAALLAKFDKCGLSLVPQSSVD